MQFQNGMEFQVSGISLDGILSSGDTIKLELTKDIKSGDLVMLTFHDNELVQPSIKLCCGISGDKITMNSETGEMWVNGKLAISKLQNDAQKFCWRDWLKFNSNVPPRHVFLLGTNDDSIDSRQRGFINMNQIIGKAHKVAT